MLDPCLPFPDSVGGSFFGSATTQNSKDYQGIDSGATIIDSFEHVDSGLTITLTGG